MEVWIDIEFGAEDQKQLLNKKDIAEKYEAHIGTMDPDNIAHIEQRNR